MLMISNKEIEVLENKYLNKFYHFLKYTEDEMMFGFQTKEKIKNDWIGKYGTNISDFSENSFFAAEPKRYASTTRPFSLSARDNLYFSRSCI